MSSSNVSSQVFLTALVINSIVAGASLVLFLLLRTKFPNIYSPRTYLPKPSLRAVPLATGLFNWLPTIFIADSREIIASNGLDAYCFVRFLRLMIEMFLPFTFFTFVVLLPIDAARSGGGKEGLDAFTFGNVGTSQTNRYSAHLILVWFFTFYTFMLLKREYASFITLRQDFLISKAHSSLPQSRTVLVTGVSREYLNIPALTRLCNGHIKGGVARIWLARNLKGLPELYARREAACDILESAEVSLLKAASKAILKASKAKSKVDLPAPTPQELEGNESLISRYVPVKDRPVHKIGGFLGLFAKKHDAVNWAREEIVTTTLELKEARSILTSPEVDETYPLETAAFIQFNSQYAAHTFAQLLAHHGPLRMNATHLEVSTADVIFANLHINPVQMNVRFALSWLMTLALIVLWVVPVAFVGLLTNVTALCSKAVWLEWLCKLPSPVNGIIQGALPPIGLVVLFIFLPIFIRMFCRFQGIPLKTLVELALQQRFFAFLIVHGFLVITLSSGLVSAIPQIISNPSSAVTLLATQLPTASTFFLTWLVTVGLGAAMGGLLQIAPLAIFYVKLVLLGSTPRKVYAIKGTMSAASFGTLFPNMTLITVIGLSYTIIAPIVAAFTFLAFMLFWVVYKYLFLYVYEQPATGETAGRFYGAALGHIFIGLYIQQICLAFLFLLAADENGKQAAIPEGILMIVLIVITLIVQSTLSGAFSPLVTYLPLSAAARMDEIALEPFDSPEENSTSNLVQKKSVEKAGHSPTPTALNFDLPIDLHAFDHPSTFKEQRTIWLPVDDNNLYRGAVQEIFESGIAVSTEGAVMTEGKVDVVRSPPDDPWHSSQSLVYQG